MFPLHLLTALSWFKGEVCTIISSPGKILSFTMCIHCTQSSYTSTHLLTCKNSVLVCRRASEKQLCSLLCFEGWTDVSRNTCDTILAITYTIGTMPPISQFSVSSCEVFAERGFPGVVLRRWLHSVDLLLTTAQKGSKQPFASSCGDSSLTWCWGAVLSTSLS